MILSKGPALNVEVPLISDEPFARPQTLVDVERGHILDVLDRTAWRIRGETGAAEILGLKPTTLESRMARLGLKRGTRISDIS